MLVRYLKEAGRYLLLILAPIVLQVAFVSHVSVLGVTADLFFITTLVVALTRGRLAGATLGFVCGLAADIAYMQPLGVRSLIYVLVAYAAAAAIARLGSIGPGAMLLLAGGLSFVSQLLYGIVQYVTGPRAGFLDLVVFQVLLGATLDALITLPAYWVLVRLRILPPVGPEAFASRGEEA